MHVTPPPDPAWFTVNVFPAIPTVPVRAAPPLEAQETVTVVDPIQGGATFVTAFSHGSFAPMLQAPNAQPLGEPVMVTVWLPAEVLGFAEVGLIE